ncbi:gamma-glutamylcyclotransferase, partial [Pseudomonadales bacterium]|nr:gamma-glutamylcyclotransferase [Pseudomonadales bacterium]
LDQREQNGYCQQSISLTLDTGQVIQAMTYIAQFGNPWDLGSPSETLLAAQIQAACGPSGTNLAYFQHLHWASQCLNEADDHLEGIALALERLGSPEPPRSALIRLQIEKALVPWHPLMR